LYFEEKGVPSDEHMKKYWLPLVLGLPDEHVDMRRSSGPMQGAYIWLLQNAELLKGLAYGLTLYLIINHGYLEPRRIANAEAFQHAKEIAATTFSDESFPEVGVAKLIEVLKPDTNKFTSPLSKVLAYHLPRFLNLDDVTKNDYIYQIKSTETLNYIRWKGQLKKLKTHPTSKVWATPQGHIIEITAGKILYAYDVQNLAVPKMSLNLNDIKATWITTNESIGEAKATRRPLDARLELRLGIGAATWAQFIPTSEQASVTFYFDKAEVISVDAEREPAKREEIPHELAAILKIDVDSNQIKAYAFNSIPLMSTDCRFMAIGGYAAREYSPEKRSKKSMKGQDKNKSYYSILDLASVPFEAVNPRMVELSSGEEQKLAVTDSAISKCYEQTNLPHARHGQPALILFPFYLQEIDMWDYVGPHPEGTKEPEALEFLDESQRLKMVTIASEIYEAAPKIIKDENIEMEKSENLEKSSDPCANISEYIKQPKAAACTIMMMLDTRDRADDLFRKLKAEEPDNPFITKEQVAYMTRGDSYWTNVRIKRLPANEFILIDETPPVNFGLSSLEICRLSTKVERTSCVGKSSPTYGDKAAISSDVKYALGRVENALGIGDTHYLIDIDRMETMDVEQIAQDYAAVGKAFSSDSKKYAVLGSQGDILVGSLPSGKVTLRLRMSQSTYTEPEHPYVAGRTFSVLQFYKNYLIMRLTAGSVLAVDDSTGKILWFSHSLGNIGKGENLKIEISEREGVAFIHDDNYGRFLSPETGIWLSGEISADNLYESNKEECDKQRKMSSAIDSQINEESSVAQPMNLDEVNLIGNGSVAVKVNECWFIRRPPLSTTTLEKTLGHVNRLIGNAKTMADNAPD